MKHSPFAPLLPLTLIAACTVGPDVAPDGPPVVPAPGPARSDPLPDPPSDDEVSLETYSYTQGTRRDPFRSSIDEEPRPAGSDPLQKWEIDQLKVIGIVSAMVSPAAMLEDPNGRGHTVRPGSLVGKNWGRVHSIFADRIVVRETHTDTTGRRAVVDVTLALPAAAALTWTDEGGVIHDG